MNLLAPLRKHYPGKAWVVVLTGSLFFFYEFIQMNMFNALDTELMTAFQASAADIGRLSGYFFDSTVLFLLFAGMLLDRFSTRFIILTGLTTGILGSYLLANAQSLPMAEISRLLSGIGNAFCFLSSVRLASRWFHHEKLAFVTSLIVTLGMLGGLVAQTPFSLLIDAVGWRQALLLNSGLGMAFFLLIAMIVEDNPADHILEDKQEHEELHKLGLLHSLQLILTNRQNWLGAFYTCLMNLPVVILGSLWGIPYLIHSHHLTKTQASLVTSMIFIGAIFGSPTAGWLSDKLGNRRLPMLVGSTTALAFILVLMLTPQLSHATLLTLFFLLGFVTSTQVIGYPFVAEHNPPMITASAVSIVSITTLAGYAIFQPLFGWLLEANGEYGPLYFQHAMLMLPIALLITLTLVAMMREPQA